MLDSVSGIAASSGPSALMASFLFGLLGSAHCAGMCGTGMTAMLIRAPRRVIASSNPAVHATAESISVQRVAQSVGVPLSGPLGAAPSTPNAGPATRISISGSTGFSSRAQPILRAALFWNLGRLLSYTFFGAIAGAFSSAAASAWLVGETMPIRALLFVVANLLVIGVGAQLTGLALLSALAKPVTLLEHVGQTLWRQLQPLMIALRRATQPEQPYAQIGAGALWGWIPCGLVYTSLATAMSVAGSQPSISDGNAALIGAGVMLAFGIGTLPMMIVLAGGATRWQQLSRMPWVRGVGGLALILIGVLNLAELPQRTELAKLLQLCATGLGLH